MILILAILLLFLGLFGLVAPQLALPLAITSLALGGGTFYVAYRRVSRIRPQNGLEAVVGSLGIATTDIDRSGQIRIANEIWTARTTDDRISAGNAIRVVELHGLTALVVRAD